MLIFCKRCLFIFFSLSSFLLVAQLDIEVQSEVALLMNADTQQVLFEKNADWVVDPASTTKIATALYVLKEVGDDLDVEIEADQDCVGSITAEAQKMMNFNHAPHWQVIGGTHMSIAKGDKHCLEDLLYGMMLISANDAANIMAKYVSGTVSSFTSELNDYLKEIGCKNTHFKNPHGLYFPGHQTSARDLALMTSEALKIPFFRQIVSTRKFKNFQNMNKLIQEGSYYYYPHAIGVKTGSHSKAGYPLVSAAEYQGRTLLLVLLKVPSEEVRYQDARALYQKAFSETKVTETFFKAGAQPFRYKLEDLDKTIKTYLKESVEVRFYPAEKPQFKAVINWHPTALPIQKGDPVADLELKDQNGITWAKADLLSSHKVSESKGKLVKILIVCAIGLIGLFLIPLFRLQSSD